MKKQTKKSFLDRIEELDMQTLVLYMVLIFSVCIVVWLFVLAIPGNFQPSFTITTEECRNEIETFDSGDNFFCSDGSRGFITKNISIDIKNTSCYLLSRETKQVCEQKEVEEIEIKCFNRVGDKIDCKGIPFGNLENTQKINDGTKIKTYFSYDETGDVTDYTIFSISKKDLTTSWLDENCECLEGENDRNNATYKIVNMMDGEIIKQKLSKEELNNFCYKGFKTDRGIPRGCIQNESFSYAISQDGWELKKCSKYSCGEYLVEVKE